ncbi:restriction endonuclease subunit S [Paracoccus fistulariae]|uniref:Restriction endonuclease subunit S n=1 Tax=Paracoccus fistulariae TaxID=658446 RepID=A0ABY7SGY0_9RHOB|nr:restriction endonuclease subunit S [Paracoccus fistulariae]MDB6182975.1 restriction endonuclease subunit S [Paracoccus fistulariae]WCR06056.1 restriction endonuclease subunit S [Paracoccus fistulariae]
MREGWHKATIGTLISSGAIQVHKDGNHGANYPRVDDFGTDGLPFLTAKSISDWTIDYQGAPRLSREKAKTFKFGFVEGGDVLLSHNATVGRVAIVPEGQETAVIGTSLTQFRVDRSRILPEFLALYFSSREFQEQLSFVMAQTTRNQVPITEQRKLPIQLPELGAQQAIVDVAFGLIDKIELNRKMNATLEAMARALFRDWFVDFGPTRAKMEGRPPYISPDLWSLFPNRLDAEGKPEGWEVRSVYDFANVVYGAPFASKQFNTDSAGIPLIRIRDLATHEPGVWTEEVHPKGHLIEPGDIVVGMDGEFRLHVWKGAPAWLNQRVCHFEPRPGVPTAFLAEALIEPLAFFERGKVGTTVIHLGKGDIDTFRLLHPGTELLSAFGEIARSLIDATVKNATESRTLAQTRDLLLPRLMSGELRVADINSEEAEHA